MFVRDKAWAKDGLAFTGLMIDDYETFKGIHFYQSWGGKPPGKIFSFAENSLAVSEENIQQAMNSLWLETKSGRESTGLILCSKNYYNLYWNSLETQQRFWNDKLSSEGFDNLRFRQADVVCDSEMNAELCSPDYMWFVDDEDRDNALDFVKKGRAADSSYQKLLREVDLKKDKLLEMRM